WLDRHRRLLVLQGTKGPTHCLETTADRAGSCPDLVTERSPGVHLLAFDGHGPRDVALEPFQFVGQLLLRGEAQPMLAAPNRFSSLKSRAPDADVPSMMQSCSSALNGWSSSSISTLTFRSMVCDAGFEALPHTQCIRLTGPPVGCKSW